MTEAEVLPAFIARLQEQLRLRLAEEGPRRQAAAGDALPAEPVGSAPGSRGDGPRPVLWHLDVVKDTLARSRRAPTRGGVKPAVLAVHGFERVDQDLVAPPPAAAAAAAASRGSGLLPRVSVWGYVAPAPIAKNDIAPIHRVALADDKVVAATPMHAAAPLPEAKPGDGMRWWPDNIGTHPGYPSRIS